MFDPFAIGISDFNFTLQAHLLDSFLNADQWTALSHARTLFTLNSLFVNIDIEVVFKSISTNKVHVLHSAVPFCLA